MFLVDDKQSEVVTTFAQLRDYFATAGKPSSAWRMGTEHELVGVWNDGRAPDYATGIGPLLARFASRDWTPVVENDHVIALTRGDEQITIEPGGQFELAGRPVTDDLTFAQDLRQHVTSLREFGNELGITWLSAGMRPFGTRDDIPWMPKLRYDVMRAYMPTVGTRGLDMMLRTATVQANLDMADELDAARKLRMLYGISPVLTALWANSPIVDGEATDYQSYRAWIWRDTDRSRCGVLPFVFERDDVFTAYTEWALDVPMYFIYRNGYRTMPAGLTFRHYMDRGYEGERATEADWALHLSTLFPDVRLKKFIEIRGCDCGSVGMIGALGPMARALAYDAQACAAATELTARWTLTDRERLSDEVPRLGLRAEVQGQSLHLIARELVEIAQDGLARLAPAAVPLLDPIAEVAASGVTHADRARQAWRQAPSVAAKIAALAL